MKRTLAHIPLDFGMLSAVNGHRCVVPRPHGFGHPLQMWSAAEWTNAMAGEVGEACNVTKKIIRLRDGITKTNTNEESILTLRSKLSDELADVILYCDLVAQACNIDLGEAVRRKFNQVSIDEGFEHRL